MIFLYIGEDDTARSYLDYHLAMLGYKIIQYKNPLKAIDNVEELLPDVVLFSATDFPRHWKPFLQIYRQFLDREKGVFLLSAGPDFSSEEAAKAEFLHVNGITDNTFSEDVTISQLKQILSRYSKIDEKRAFSRYIPFDCDVIELVFTHPKSFVMITGKVKNISEDVLSLRPDNPLICTDLVKDVKIPSASITIGEDLFTAECIVLRNKDNLALKITKIADHFKEVLFSYIQDRAERQLHKLVKKS
jgi:hypothetical protein